MYTTRMCLFIYFVRKIKSKQKIWKCVSIFFCLLTQKHTKHLSNLGDFHFRKTHKRYSCGGKMKPRRLGTYIEQFQQYAHWYPVLCDRCASRDKALDTQPLRGVTDESFLGCDHGNSAAPVQNYILKHVDLHLDSVSILLKGIKLAGD